MPSDNLRPELIQLLEELEQLADEQRSIDVRDSNALGECERKLADLRRRLVRLQTPDGVAAKSER